MEIKRFDETLSVCKVVDYSEVDLSKRFVFVGATGEENSLVCQTVDVPKNTTERDDNWRMMKIQGILDFSLIGILSRISSILADHKIGIFAVSTYNTDYILVKEENYENALSALADEGYTIV